MMGSRYGGVPDTIVKPLLTLQGAFNVQNQAAGTIPFDIQGVAGQTAFIARFRDSAGTTLFSIDNSGNLVIAGTATITINEAVIGNLSLTGNLSVTGISTLTGATSIGSTLAVTGRTTFSSTVGFGTNTTIIAESHQIGRDENEALVYNVPLVEQHLFTVGGTQHLSISSTTISMNDNVVIGGTLTVNGNATITGDLVVGGTIEADQFHVGDNEYFTMGNTAASPDVRLGWNTTQTVDGFYLGLSDGQNTFVIAENGDRAFDFAHGAQTNPTVFIHSAAQSTTEALRLNYANVAFLGAGLATTATEYSIGRNADATNRLQLNVPTGAIHEISVNDVAVVFVTATTLQTLLGSAVQPSFVSMSDTNTGLYWTGSDVLGFSTGGVSRMTIADSAVAITQGVATSGSPVGLTFTGGAHTTIAASVEATDINFNLARTVQFGTGALATQRAMIISAPTYGFVGVSTITSAYTVDINRPPRAGTNATITTAAGLNIGGVGSDSNATNSLGLSIYPLAIRNGYGAMTSLVGIGVSDAGLGISLGNQTATLTNLNAIRLEAITYTSTDLVRTVTNPATLYIGGAPVASTNVTFSNTARAIEVAAGTVEMNNYIVFNTGVAVVATDYSIGRDADGTNQFHLNVPTGATFELSVNDVAEMTLSATAVNFQNNTITTTGGGSLTGTWSDLGSVTTIDINGGTVDGATIGGAVAGAITGTTITANTNFVPDADDGAGLGLSGTAFSDLFLASGAVINFAAGDITLTHSANLLDIAGGTVGIRAAASTSIALHVGWNNDTMPAATTAARHFQTSGNITELSGATITDIVGAYFNTFTITDGGGAETVGIVSTVYIPNAPTVGTTPSNGPYALFVDAGTTRLDGIIQSGTSINSLDAVATSLVLQNQTFTAGAGHVAVQLTPSWGAENFQHTGLRISATQNGSNSSSLIGFQTGIVQSGAGTLVDGFGIIVAQPSVGSAVTTNRGIRIVNQNIGNVIDTSYGIEILNQTGTTTTAYGLYIENADTYSIWVDAGTTRLDGILQQNEAIYFTQTDGNEKIDSAADGYLDYTVTTAHRFNMSAADTDVRLEFIGTTASGLLEWMEDEDYFRFGDSVLFNAGKIQTGADVDIDMSAGGRLQGGGIQANYQTLAANTNLTLDENDSVVEVTTGAVSDNTITLPAASGNEGMIVSVYLITDGGQNAVITRAGADVIQNGSGDLANTTVTLNDAGDYALLQCVSASMWQIVTNFGGVVA